MKYDRMSATVKGVTEDGEEFATLLQFTMLPPEDGKAHYGTGYYMRVKIPANPAAFLVDVRYEKTTDIEILADRWITNYFGNNAREVTKVFED